MRPIPRGGGRGGGWERVIEQRGVRQWADIAFSSIYYLLDKLAKRHLIEPEEPSAAKKARRVFRCTDEGQEAARRCARTLVADLHVAPHPFLLGLAHLSLLSEGEYAAALAGRLDRVTAQIAAVTQTAQAQGTLPVPASEVFTFSLSLLEAERSWLAQRVQVPHE